METRNNVLEVVLIGNTTLANVKQVLVDTTQWLQTDAKYAHPKSKIHKFKENVQLTLAQIREDETKFLGKRFEVAKSDDNT